MRHYLGVAKEKGLTEGAIREAMAAVVATNGGRPRAQAREALKGLLDPIPITHSTEGCCGHEKVR
jgi:alkylhydroperoxidase/carboxymuconolactone decarboxylase family protein YurZ